MSSKIVVQPIIDRNIWENFLSQHPEANFLHSWYWGEFHERLNHKIIRRGFFKEGQLIGVMLMIVEPARRGRHLIVPAGPILDWPKFSNNKVWLDELKLIAKDNKCVFVRLRPQLPNDENSSKIFQSLGFRKAPMHLHAELTSQLDLTKNDEELKHAMRKGTRYDINRVARLGIKVEAVEDDRFIDEFYDLQLETARRQKFVPFSKKFLYEQLQVFGSAGKALMYRSTSSDDKLLAMAFIIFYGSEAAYHYGASTDLARQLPGAYAIQWQAIHDAQKFGCSRYNFWGVTEHGLNKHRFYGVSVFKRGFGGQDVAYLPAQDLIIDPIRYGATYLIETSRRKFRHL